ncbi:MAG TPA: BglG family transcription antiterminator [Bacilli bacterium]
MEQKMVAKLNSRQQQILLFFLESSDYAHLNALADRLNISLRTIQRELSELENYMAQWGLHFDRKVGAGLKLLGNKQDLAELKNLLAASAKQSIYSAEERLSILKRTILSCKEPIKLYALGKELHVAVSTILNDLKKIEPWLERYDISLNRKHGVGLYIEGSERNIRSALADLLYENVTQEQLMEFIFTHSGNEREKLNSAIRFRLLNFIDPQWLFRIEEVIQEFEQKRGYRMADNAYVGFVVHLALAAQRLKANEAITIEDKLGKQLQATKEYKLAAELAAALSERLKLPFPESEIGYITMHILAARSNHVMNSDYDYSLTIEYARNMISIMEHELKLELESDDMLIRNLTTHLASAIKRIELDMEVRNPLLRHVKEEYREIFEATRKATMYLAQKIGKPVPEEEIGYLAMHFGTAILNKREALRYKVLLVCSSGIGAARMLQVQIKKKLPLLQVVDTISLSQIENWISKRYPVDLVLSTLPLHLEGVNVIVVNPFLTDDDIAAIKTQLPRLARTEHGNVGDRSSIEQAVDKAERYGKALAALRDNIEVMVAFTAASKRHLIENIMAFVAEHFAVDHAAKLQRDLLDREKLGPLLLEEERFAILHCRSGGIKEMAVCLFRLEHEIDWEVKDRKVPVRTVLTMLGPIDAPNENYELASEISMALIEEEAFMKTLISGTLQEIHASIQFVLKKGYVKLAGQLLG